MAHVFLSHPELRDLRNHLQSIHDSISHFQPPVKRPPILDSSLGVIQNPAQDTHWFQHDNIPGLKKLKESIKVDLDALDKFLNDAGSAHLPPLSTNAPYLIAVWNEVLCAPAPILCVFKSFFGAAGNSDVRGHGQSSSQTSRTQGTKVDIVADCGRKWIRINTIKNSRIFAEFREIDSYLTDDESSSDEEDVNYRPSLAQTEFDNSVLRMGRSLVAAAKVNLVRSPVSHPSSEELIPRITLRLTRLNPNSEPHEPRIAQTIQILEDMGINVQLGERTPDEIPKVQPNNTPHVSSLVFEPTTKINLDLSVLIALISDLTHSPLPTTIDEANSRFIPPERYLDWKKKLNVTKAKARKVVDPDFNDEDFELSLPAQQDMAKTTRALTNQVLQEMGKGLVQEIADRLNALESGPSHDARKNNIEFWTTPEARDRCLRIVSKVGGPKEKLRAQGLLFDSSAPNGKQLSDIVSSDIDADYPFPFPDTLGKAQDAFWNDSRYARNFIPLVPLRFYPVSSAPSLSADLESLTSTMFCSSRTPIQEHPPFFRSLHTTCSDILEYEKHSRSKGGPRALKGNFDLGPRLNTNYTNRVNRPTPNELYPGTAPSINYHKQEHDEQAPNTISDFPRATITKASPRLTAHTVQSLAWGSALGWTTLTANRTSVKAIVKEINARSRMEMFKVYMGPGRAPVVLDSAEGFVVDDNGNGVTSSTRDSMISTTSVSSPSSASLPRTENLVYGADGTESVSASNHLKAAIWIIDPRSLAEGMRADSVDDG